MEPNNALSDDSVLSIKSIPYFQTSIYHDLNIPATIDFFTRRYVNPMNKLCDIRDLVVVDCGAGHGWFSLAYVLAGGKAVIAVDTDADRLTTAQRIANILNVENRIRFIVSPIHELDFDRDSIDFFVSIETLEHVGKDNIPKSLQRIKDITSKGIIITSPNKLFPVIAHDTRLPFAHWLPNTMRGKYAKLFKREKLNHNNQFLSPADLNILLDKFKPVTSCLTYQNYSEYINEFPYYLPYGSDENMRMQTKPSIGKSSYYKFVSAFFGNYSYWVMPTLARIFLRR